MDNIQQVQGVFLDIVLSLVLGFSGVIIVGILVLYKLGYLIS